MKIINKIPLYIKNWILFCGLFGILSIESKAQKLPPIIPKPHEIEMGDGFFIMDNHVSIQYNSKQKDLKPIANFLDSYVKNISSFSLPINKLTKKKVEFSIQKGIPEEGYELAISPAAILIKASSSK